MQAGLMQACLPELTVSGLSPDVNLGALFSHSPRDVWLEIGFGGGEHLAARAEAQPEIGFIGCEPFVNGVAKLVVEITERGLKNIRIYPDDARGLIKQLPESSVAGVYLLYPDPWPKRRQKKRRFISDEMLQKLAHVMRPQAELRFATDIDDYSGWALARILRSAEFVWPAGRSSDWLASWQGWPGTRYEAKAKLENRPPVYLTFRRV